MIFRLRIAVFSMVCMNHYKLCYRSFQGVKKVRRHIETKKYYDFTKRYKFRLKTLPKDMKHVNSSLISIHEII